MKHLFLGMLVAAMPVAVDARPPTGPALHTAQALVMVFQNISSDAQMVAHQARRNGIRIRAQRFRDLSHEASQVSMGLRRLVVRPLAMGAARRRALNNLESMRHEFMGLRQAVMVIQMMPPFIQMKLERSRNLRRQLRTQLSGFGPGPGPGLFECTAVDTGWEEHIFRPHVGYGPTLRMAQMRALQVCQREHGSCRIRSCNRR